MDRYFYGEFQIEEQGFLSGAEPSRSWRYALVLTFPRMCTWQVEKRTEVALLQAKLQGAQREAAAVAKARDEVRIWLEPAIFLSHQDSLCHTLV